jgi:hypothetical protein
MKFNIGDWIVVNERPYQVTQEDIDTCLEYPKYFDDVEKWNPKIGDFVIPNNVSQVSFRVVRVLTEPDNLGFFQSDVGLLNNKSCEPFMNALPSFIKE